ncbi:hypothetical protein [Bythopirellula goksoeyrii]|uniref:Uncharacterized protein n=1 Tax=Bythopirellula goksoeyrii TaxID=1400387 RepID=A0A5B9QT54_9BACT|nr:hypothetical protein [Bythopirellula goksoeyrii]QEG37291.1 hypothetical protein Pr1d_46320 [Bythopirellula goksoeyrii]
MNSQDHSLPDSPSRIPHRRKEGLPPAGDVTACIEKENVSGKNQEAQGYPTFVITPIFTGGIISTISRV